MVTDVDDDLGDKIGKNVPEWIEHIVTQVHHHKFSIENFSLIDVLL